ncbi:MAG: hypothetical protein ACK4OP_17780, partial [Gemmobacter sp.]
MTTTAAVEAAYRSARRARLGQTALILAAIAGATALSADLGEVDLARLWSRLDRFGSYFGRMVPVLTWDNLGGDIAQWFRRFDRWFAGLIDTILIAFYATVFGAAFAIAGAF